MHIERCINSVLGLQCRVVVVDSFSDDSTEGIVRQFSSDFYQNKFVNQATQLEWAMSNCEINTEWVFRLDADEYISTDLLNEMKGSLGTIEQEADGVLIKRRVVFMDRWIRWGGYYPIWILRLWKVGKGFVENKAMDEKIRIPSKKIIKFKNDIVEENLNSLSWWIAKHNDYATREMEEIIKQKKEISSERYIRTDKQDSNQWYKHNLYYKLPILIRPFLYFIYRYFFKLGFLDGKSGFVWHVLQGFWYRFLIDAKYLENKRKRI